MNKMDLSQFMDREANYHDLVEVVFQDTDTGKIFSVDAVVYEAESTDGEGNSTSTGATLFLRGTAR